MSEVTGEHSNERSFFLQLKGTEEPLETGRVKAASRGSRLDLSLRKGESVVILRMDQNPPGKWLVRNDKGEGQHDHSQGSSSHNLIQCSPYPNTQILPPPPYRI